MFGPERDACGIGFLADRHARSSRWMVETSLEALGRVRHRGAVAADSRTGDGAGLLFPLPRPFLTREARRLGMGRVSALAPYRFGVGVFFVRGEETVAREVVEAACAAERIRVVGWREVPVEPAALGDVARRSMPLILHAILEGPPGLDTVAAEWHAHRARRRAETAAREAGVGLYVPSLSFLSIVYKALTAADRLADFYPDLADPMLEAPFVIFHQRYSTNTGPTWERAQPFRLLAHNGEINTIAGNVNRMRSREGRLGAWSPAEEEWLRPVIDTEGSDSAMLDNVLELLIREGWRPGEGRDVRHALAMLIPAAWEGDERLADEVRDFYRYHASLMEPWDGPAALVFTDGLGVGASLDRNGLRPLRYAICEDGLVVCASEVGVADLEGRGDVVRGRLGPGQMLFVKGGRVDLDPVGRIARRRPYGRWVAEHRMVRGPGEPAPQPTDDLLQRQVAHGYTRDDLSVVLRSAAGGGKEPTYAMGDDTPLPPLSAHRRPAYHYFRQRFAQVTNPPLDHLRERHVMSLTTLLGPRDPLLRERPEAAALIEQESFFLFRAPGGYQLDATWPAAEGPEGMERALERVAAEAVEAATQGSGILLLTDEAAGRERVPIPSLLAVGAVNAALLRAGHRTRASLVVRTDDAREAHHVACLLGYGAEAVEPRLALATVADLAERGKLRGAGPGEALLGFRAAVEEGVLKVLSKMGIATVDSYQGAQIFDAVGLAPEVIDRCFPGTVSVLGSVGFADLAADALTRHAEAYGEEPAIGNPGFVKHTTGGEYHQNEPRVVRALHLTVDPGLDRLKSTAAAGDDDLREVRAAHALHRALREGLPQEYARFADLVDGRPASAPRDLVEPAPAGPPVPLEEVEPAEAILRRFSTGAMSHGAISKEAHETIALALRMVGGKANTGEGGEDPARYRDERNSAIKQVASARFGVTPEYLAFAEELQIKMAQGSKPGEGGQLPGHKVSEEIARLRHTRPGVALISPPPHHDIYSIEDLAQLIHDLKQVAPEADVSVKLVAEAGVGTIAAGVAKALAEVVHIAGADGGTGASPLSSIKHAGLPWEVGLAEAQRVLAADGLRDRVRIRVDGGLKTGRDVVLAALLGADEVSFGTAALLAEGCIMVRTCHLDTCPVGIATQRPELRAKFAATPEMVAGYLRHVAEDARRLLASLGLRSFEDAIGRTDLLEPREQGDRTAVDLRAVLAPPPEARRFVAPSELQRPRSRLGDRLHRDAWPAIRGGGTADLTYEIRNRDRTVGARLGGAIGRTFGSEPPPGRATATFRGSAGQSFGAFLAAGVELRLEGEANDYVGKGMGGGRIAILSPPEAEPGVLAGNTILYGATGGELFVAGFVGERFAVRNSGATAVVEGTGDHACEYMTGGVVVVLGPVGMNLGAGMTGGEVFVYDPESRLQALVNQELVTIARPEKDGLARVRGLVERHAEATGSPRATALLASWDAASQALWVVAPRPDVTDLSRKEEGTAGTKKASSPRSTQRATS